MKNAIRFTKGPIFAHVFSPWKTADATFPEVQEFCPLKNDFWEDVSFASWDAGNKLSTRVFQKVFWVHKPFKWVGLYNSNKTRELTFGRRCWNPAYQNLISTMETESLMLAGSPLKVIARLMTSNTGNFSLRIVIWVKRPNNRFPTTVRWWDFRGW